MAAAAEFGDAGGSVGHEDGEQKVYNNFADQQKCFQINEILLYFAKRYKVIGPAIID